MPKVSVIIPVYGVEKYIERCARSLFEQTLDDIEYLFIDDCSPDRSIEILKNVLEEYPNRKDQVIVHRMEKNSGQAAVRKWGMLNATGDYVIHCDSDDWVDSKLYQIMYSDALENNSDLVVCDYQIHNGECCIKCFEGCRTKDVNRFQENLLSEKNAWALWNKLIKRNLIEYIEYFPEKNMGEDLVLCMQMICFSQCLSYVENVYYYYFINEESIVHIKDTETIISKYYQNHDNLNLLIKFYRNQNLFDKLKKHIDWLKYTVKRNLYIKDSKIAKFRKTVYPFLEYKLLLNSEISNTQKKELVKMIYDQLINKI